jgi:hypothetical protein
VIPPVTHVLINEGENWIPFEKISLEGYLGFHGHVHALRFQDGTVWDCINGFRPRDFRFDYEWAIEKIARIELEAQKDHATNALDNIRRILKE